MGDSPAAQFPQPEAAREGPLVRAATHADIDEIVAVHLRGFAGFFLSFLGRRFLKLFYRSLLSDPTGILLVREENRRVMGFVAGVTCQEGFFRRILARHVLGFGWAALGALLRRPQIAPRLLRAFARSGEARESAAMAGLLSIAVRPEDQGRGFGRELVAAFTQVLAARDVEEFCLTTDRNANERANRFYRRLGLRVVREYETPEGRAMNEYLFSAIPAVNWGGVSGLAPDQYVGQRMSEPRPAQQPVPDSGAGEPVPAEAPASRE